MMIITIIMIMVVTIWIQNDEINVLQWQIWQNDIYLQKFLHKDNLNIQNDIQK